MKYLKQLYLCPGDEHGAHITDDYRNCWCGNSNLVSLSSVLNRSDKKYQERPYQGIASDLPTIERIMSARAGR